MAVHTGEAFLWKRGGKERPCTEETLPYISRSRKENYPAKECCETALWTQTVYVSGNYFHAGIGVPFASCHGGGWGCL